MKRVYVAGAMSSPDPIQFMENLRRGQRMSAEILLAGYAVFSPFIDIALFLQLRDGESIPVETIRESSMAWLKVSDAVLVVPGWEGSKGTRDELAAAKTQRIPIYYSLDDMNTVLQWKEFCGGE